MKVKLPALLILLALAASAHALSDISVGPFFGMNMPLANKDAKSGSLIGFQAKYSPIAFFAVGGHYQGRKYGDPSEDFFYGPDTKDGGSVTSLGIDAYLGKTSGTGVNFYLVGSLGSYKWKRENQGEISKTTYSFGPGLEVVLPMKLGIEGRAMFDIAPTGESGSWKALLWFVGVNYHIGIGPM